MNDKQFNTLVQMIAQLSARMEEINTSLGARIDTLGMRINTLEASTRRGFADQAKIINSLATTYDTHVNPPT